MKNKQIYMIMSVIMIVVFGAIAIWLVNSNTMFVFQQKREGTLPTRDSKDQAGRLDLSEDEMKKMSGKNNILLMGVDTGSFDHDKEALANSFMIFHIDDEQKEIRLASIYKDTMVEIEDHGYEALKQAHAYDGSRFALATVNRNLDLCMEYYATINYYRFDTLVDLVGGIELEILEDEVDAWAKEIEALNKERDTDAEVIACAGTYRVDGIQAVAYTRIETDMAKHHDRSERQRTVLFKTLSEAKKLNKIGQLKVSKALMKITLSNISRVQMVRFVENLASYSKEMQTYPNTYYGGVIDGNWYEVPCTLKDLNQDMHQFLYGIDTYQPTKEVSDISKYLREMVEEPNFTTGN